MRAAPGTRFVISVADHSLRVMTVVLCAFHLLVESYTPGFVVSRSFRAAKFGGVSSSARLQERTRSRVQRRRCGASLQNKMSADNARKDPRRKNESPDDQRFVGESSAKGPLVASFENWLKERGVKGIGDTVHVRSSGAGGLGLFCTRAVIPLTQPTPRHFDGASPPR